MIKKTKIGFYGRHAVHNEYWRLPQQTNRLHRYYSGSFTLSCNGKEIQIQAGHTYLFPQNLPFHPNFDPEDYIDHSYVDFLAFPAIACKEIIDIDPDKYPLLNDVASLCFKLSKRCFVMESVHKKAEYERLLENELTQLLNLIRMEFPVTFSKNTRINTVVEYMHAHYAENITLEQLADMAYCAKNYFVRLFKEEMGCTPYQYLKIYRFIVAQQLLRKGMNVKDVAHAIGYSDAYAFSSAFHKQFKIYPSVYQPTRPLQESEDMDITKE